MEILYVIKKRILYIIARQLADFEGLKELDSGVNIKVEMKEAKIIGSVRFSIPLMLKG